MNKAFFIVVGLIGIIASMSVVYSETNLFYKQPGSEFDYKYSHFSQEDTPTGGVITIERHSETSYVADWVSFGDNRTYSYFTFDHETWLERDLTIKVPEKTVPGRKYFTIKVTYMNGETYEDVIGFRIN